MRLVWKFLAPAVLAMCVAMPNPVFASSTVDFANMGGTLTATTGGMSLSGSTLIAVTGFDGNGLVTGNLGTVSFSTGAMVNGSLQMGGTFNDGTFTVESNAGFGQLGSGVLFSGSFNGPVTWTLITLANGTHNYVLSGVLTGSINGINVSGVSVQLTVNTGRGLFNGSATLSSGDTSLSPTAVPEPPTLGLIGIGIFGLAAAVRRKALSQQAAGRVIRVA
jgi:hypothetical protein